MPPLRLLPEPSTPRASHITNQHRYKITLTPSPPSAVILARPVFSLSPPITLPSNHSSSRHRLLDSRTTHSSLPHLITCASGLHYRISVLFARHSDNISPAPCVDRSSSSSSTPSDRPVDWLAGRLHCSSPAALLVAPLPAVASRPAPSSPTFVSPGYSQARPCDRT